MQRGDFTKFLHGSDIYAFSLCCNKNIRIFSVAFLNRINSIDSIEFYAKNYREQKLKKVPVGFLQTIFPMPPVDRRNIVPILSNDFHPSSHQIEDIISNTRDPDMYINLRAWNGLFKISFLAVFIAFALAFLYHFHGWLPELKLLFHPENNMSGLVQAFAYLMEFFALLPFLSTVYYLVYFSIYVDWKKYAFHRFYKTHKGTSLEELYSGKTGVSPVLSVFTLVLVFFVGLLLPFHFHNVIDVFGTFVGLQTNILFVGVIALLSGYVLSVSFYIVYRGCLSLSYLAFKTITK